MVIPDDSDEEIRPLSHEEQIDLLNNTLTNVIHYYAKEFRLTNETIVGVIEYVKADFLSKDTYYFLLDDEP